VISDWMMPQVDGLELCQSVKTGLRESAPYFILLTAKGELSDRLLGLETGADDYLAKPISVRELKARVNAMFRRPRRLVDVHGDVIADHPPGSAGDGSVGESHELLSHGELTVDVDAHRAWRSGDEIDLTPTEFGLLTTLLRAPSRVWSRALLMEEVWGQTWGETHHVEVHMGNLRRKLGDRRGNVRFVETVRGVGYRLRPVD
jgi:two-component system OmpR family response regulator